MTTKSLLKNNICKLSDIMGKNEVWTKFYVIGDSHVRSFSANENFFPIYIGSGNAHCFISFEHFFNVLGNILYLQNILPYNANVIFAFGEPDTRYSLGRGWQPWNEDAINVKVSEKQPEISAKRMLQLVNIIMSISNWNIFILSVPPTQNFKQLSLIKRFNAIIKKQEQFYGYTYLDIFSEVKGINGTIKERYRGDIIHVNTSIQSPIETILSSKGFVLKENDNKIILSGKDLKNYFSTKNKFGCYSVPNSIIARIKKGLYIRQLFFSFRKKSIIKKLQKRFYEPEKEYANTLVSLDCGEK